MALVTSYATLQTEVERVLNRTDLTTGSEPVKNFIQDAEASLRRDPRCRKFKTGTLSVDAEEVALPADFSEPESLYHNGPTYFGPIEVVSPDILGGLRGRFGLSATGVPRYGAIIDGPVIRFAPPPDATYTLELGYWLTVPSLSDAATTNWLLLDHPDIYKYAALVESAPFLKADERLPMWRSELDRRLEELHRKVKNQRFGGTMVVRPSYVFG